MSSQYEESIIDFDPVANTRVATPSPGIASVLTSDTLTQLAHAGAGGFAGTRAGGAADFTARGLPVNVIGERYVVAARIVLRRQAAVERPGRAMPKQQTISLARVRPRVSRLRSHCFTRRPHELHIPSLDPIRRRCRTERHRDHCRHRCTRPGHGGS